MEMGPLMYWMEVAQQTIALCSVFPVADTTLQYGEVFAKAQEAGNALHACCPALRPSKLMLEAVARCVTNYEDVSPNEDLYDDFQPPLITARILHESCIGVALLLDDKYDPDFLASLICNVPHEDLTKHESMVNGYRICSGLDCLFLNYPPEAYVPTVTASLSTLFMALVTKAADRPMNGCIAVVVLHILHFLLQNGGLGPLAASPANIQLCIRSAAFVLPFLRPLPNCVQFLADDACKYIRAVERMLQLGGRAAVVEWHPRATRQCKAVVE